MSKCKVNQIIRIFSQRQQNMTQSILINLDMPVFLLLQPLYVITLFLHYTTYCFLGPLVFPLPALYGTNLILAINYRPAYSETVKAFPGFYTECKKQISCNHFFWITLFNLDGVECHFPKHGRQECYNYPL